MKRWVHRTVGVAIGLSLGWLAAGWAPTLIHAQEEAEHATAVSGSGAGHEHEMDQGRKAAVLLVPEASDVPWLKPVLMAAGGLFVAAVVFGLPALKLKGAEPPDPALQAPTHGDAHGHH